MASGRAGDFAKAAKSLSKRLVFSYTLDWLVLVVLGLVAFGFTLIDPHFRPFSPLDLSISFPYIPEAISVPVLAAACVLAPAVIIAGVIFLFVPGPAAFKRMSAGEIMRIKIWEFNVGWLGLALAHATQFLLVQGVKNIVGKPRPDMLDRCKPDLENIQDYVVGGFGRDISPLWVLVNHKICTQTNHHIFREGFRSFPSGHNSTAFAGMFYLSLYLASKFGVAFPTLPFHKRDVAGATADVRAHRAAGGSRERRERGRAPIDFREFGYRDEAAGAPIWTVLLVYVPMGVAIYIGSTRFFEYYHHGFDVLAGTAIGLLSGWIGFRWYHGPVGRSAGWAWSPRSRNRAFGIGVGTLGYVADSHPGGTGQPQDVELGRLNVPSRTDTHPGWQGEHDESAQSSSNSPQPAVHPSWQKDQFDSMRSSAVEERRGF